MNSFFVFHQFLTSTMSSTLDFFQQCLSDFMEIQLGKATYRSTSWDGMEQFYCQAEDCASNDASVPMQPSTAQLGTDSWQYFPSSCSCIKATRISTDSTFLFTRFFNSVGGLLNFPCHFVDPNDPIERSHCKLGTSSFINLLYKMDRLCVNTFLVAVFLNTILNRIGKIHLFNVNGINLKVFQAVQCWSSIKATSFFLKGYRQRYLLFSSVVRPSSLSI